MFQKDNTWKEVRRTLDSIKFDPRGTRPEGLQHAGAEISALKDIRIRLKILALIA